VHELRMYPPMVALCLRPFSDGSSQVAAELPQDKVWQCGQCQAVLTTEEQRACLDGEIAAHQILEGGDTDRPGI
jgi:hypothetical protein